MEDYFEDSAEAEAYQHLAFSNQRKPRLKNAINLENCMRGQPVKFEVEDSKAEIALHDEDEDLEDLEMDTYAATFTKDALASYKNANTLKVLAEMDFVTLVFSELEETMMSIHSNGLVKKEVVKAGTGLKVPKNGKIFMHYVAICEGADDPFDSTVLTKVPRIVDMRNADIIAGLYVAVLSMELKEVSKFIVKSSMAFGPFGIPPKIPPSADILFIVEVLHFIDENMLKTPLFMTAEERARLPFKEVYAVAEELQTNGNGNYQDGNFWSAVKKYRKAVTVLEDYPVAESAVEEDRCKLLHTLYANLAQCYLMLEKPSQACSACKLGLRQAKGKSSVKLLFRFAKAKLQLKDCDAAKGLCDEALKFEPNNRDVRDLKAKIQFEDNKQTAASTELFRGMFKK